MLPSQLPLFMPAAPAPTYAEDDFIVGAHNAHAVGYLEEWAQSRAAFHPIAILTGSRGAGKTHLAQIWAQQTGAYVCDTEMPMHDILAHIATNAVVLEKDAVNLLESDLFAVLNAALNAKNGLLIVSQNHPEFWKLSLNDAKSRLRAAPILKLNAPSDDVIYALLFKHFVERQIVVETDVVKFASVRLPRNFAAIAQLVAKADEFALIHKRAVTKSVISAILTQDFAHINEQDEAQFGLFEDNLSNAPSALAGAIANRILNS